MAGPVGIRERRPRVAAHLVVNALFRRNFNARPVLLVKPNYAFERSGHTSVPARARCEGHVTPAARCQRYLPAAQRDC